MSLVLIIIIIILTIRLTTVHLIVTNLIYLLNFSIDDYSVID